MEHGISTEAVSAGNHMVDETKRSQEFDELLLLAIDETIRYVMGDGNTTIIYEYLEANSCSKTEIPQKLDLFSLGLRDLIGTGRGQMCGTACILEETIAEALAMKLGKKFEEKRLPLNFPEYVRELKRTYEESCRLIEYSQRPTIT